VAETLSILAQGGLCSRTTGVSVAGHATRDRSRPLTTGSKEKEPDVANRP
jgi:hypothetical protein